MKMFFAFAALVALVAAQCNPEGNTYTWVDTTDNSVYSLTFGAAVGDWLPGLMNPADVNNVGFATWHQATETRWEVSEFGSSSPAAFDDFCALWGQYSFNWQNGCEQVTISRINDPCPERAPFLERTWTLYERPDDASCLGAGTELTTTLGEDADWAVISGEDATYIFGTDEFALVSVSDKAVVVQRWREVSGLTLQVVDLGSYPAGFSCPGTEVGTYYHVSSWGGQECAVRICGETETCVHRAALLNGAAFDGFQGDQCSTSVQLPPAPTFECSPGIEWLKPAEECVWQDVEGGCAFCQGIAMGVTTQWCIRRDGARCNDIFNSPTTQTFCNVAFECPASTATVSFVALFISALLALLF